LQICKFKNLKSEKQTSFLGDLIGVLNPMAMGQTKLPKKQLLESYMAQSKLVKNIVAKRSEYLKQIEVENLC
jgi:hypothetical protein